MGALLMRWAMVFLPPYPRKGGNLYRHPEQGIWIPLPLSWTFKRRKIKDALRTRAYYG